MSLVFVGTAMLTLRLASGTKSVPFLWIPSISLTSAPDSIPNNLVSLAVVYTSSVASKIALFECVCFLSTASAISALV